jgi:hypothetical protein
MKKNISSNERKILVQMKKKILVQMKENINTNERKILVRTKKIK